MPVEHHESSEQVKRASDTPYGCKDRVLNDVYFMNVRQYLGDGTYRITGAFIPHTMSKTCRYDKSTADPRCAECKWRGEGEKYDQRIRRNGT